MNPETSLWFADFRLDVPNASLWHGEREIKLKPKAFDVLCYLVRHAGQLVSKDALWQAVWPHVVVSDAVLTVCVGEIRQALADDAKTPRFIETVHRRGYRFLGEVVSSKEETRDWRLETGSSSPQASSLKPQAPTLVGRETELRQLHQWLAKAAEGTRQLVFVTGESGIGKTSIVETFLASVAATHGWWIGRGQCVEHYGVGEAYLPVLQALGALGRGPDHLRFRTLLEQHAPSWLAQMPALLNLTERESMQSPPAGAPRERMLREMAEAVETLTAVQGLVLVLEDLHWSDASTVELVALLARRREPARLLVIGTYRPVDMIVGGHPLKRVKQDLQLHELCTELPLQLLSEAAVGDYLTTRFQVQAPPASTFAQLARAIHQRTDGNPLFMSAVVTDLVGQGLVVNADGTWELPGGVTRIVEGMPENLRQLVEQQIEQLQSQDQCVLETASVVGMKFSAGAIAAGLGEAVETVEQCCAKFQRQNLFVRAGRESSWPHTRVAEQYEFLHALYQQVWYERIPPVQRARLHQQIGAWGEQTYGEQAKEMATILAMHFERGRDYVQAVRYLGHAGQNALRRSASQEAVAHLTKAIAFVRLWPDTPERQRQELGLITLLGPALITTMGYAAPEVGSAYARARELCQRLGETPQLFPVLCGLGLFHLQRAELQTAYTIGEQLLDLARQEQERVLVVVAHRALGTATFWLGQLTTARQHLEEALAVYQPQDDRAQAAMHGEDPGISCRVYLARVLWMLGYPDQAVTRAHEAVALAKELGDPFSLAYAQSGAAFLYQLRRENRVAQEWAEVAITVCAEHAFPFVLAWSQILRGATLVGQTQEERGIAEIRSALTAHHALGAALGRPHLLTLLAGACGQANKPDDGLEALVEVQATAAQSGEQISEAERYRLTGELTLQKFQVSNSKFQVEKGPKSKVQYPKASKTKSQILDPKSQAEGEAEACFLKAIEIARQQEAKSLELRATTSLARLWRQQGKQQEAHQKLSRIYDWFTEGFDTEDLQDAKALLEDLGETAKRGNE